MMHAVAYNVQFPNLRTEHYPISYDEYRIVSYFSSVEDITLIEIENFIVEYDSSILELDIPIYSLIINDSYFCGFPFIYKENLYNQDIFDLDCTDDFLKARVFLNLDFCHFYVKLLLDCFPDCDVQITDLVKYYNDAGKNYNVF